MQYSKLLVNLHNGVNALAGHPLAQTYADRRLRLVIAACHSEALALLQAAGIRPISRWLVSFWRKLLLSCGVIQFAGHMSRVVVTAWRFGLLLPFTLARR